MDLFKTPAIGIIGTAGRKDDAARLKGDSFDLMYATACETIGEWGVKEAISGGAAWADHIAVRAFLDSKVARLHLHFPAPFAERKFQATEAGEIANYYHHKFTAVRRVDSLSEIDEAIVKGASVTVGNGFHARNRTIGRDATHLLAFTFGAGSAAISDCAGEDAGYRDAVAAGLKDGGTPLHGSDGETDSRRKALVDFGPGSKGFMDAAAAGLRDGGTAHTWSKAKGPGIKRHVHLGVLLAPVAAPVPVGGFPRR